MSYYNKKIKEIAKIEKNNFLYSITAFKIPIWRLIRSSIVEGYLTKKCNFEKRNTTKRSVNWGHFFKYYFLSFYSLIRVYFHPKIRAKYVFFAFPRLQEFENKYIDKFTDPVIKESGLLKEFVIFQRPLSGKHFKPRYKQGAIIPIDFIEYTTKILGVVFSPLFFIIYIKSIFILYKRANMTFGVNKKFLFSISAAIGAFLFSSYCFKLLFGKLKTQKIFFVNRELNFPITYAAKRKGITTYELQHGITLDWSILYSHQYCPAIDPDYFLAFGKFWKGKQFGIPVERIINIGWAFGKFIRNVKASKNVLENYILIVSEPNSSNNIIKIALEMAQLYTNYIFHIRPHPQEEISGILKNRIEKLDNISIQDNKVESSIALLPYQYVVGHKSSVLYEALSFGKNVGCLNFNGCKANSGQIENNPFVIINSINEFTKLKEKKRKKNQNIINSFYSYFDENKFNEIILSK